MIIYLYMLRTQVVVSSFSVSFNLSFHPIGTVNIILRVANYIARYAPSEKKLYKLSREEKYSGNIPDFLRKSDILKI